MHVDYGVPIALNAGDALATLGAAPAARRASTASASRMTRAVAGRVPAHDGADRRRAGGRARMAGRQRRATSRPSTTSTWCCARRARTPRSCRCGRARSSARGAAPTSPPSRSSDSRSGAAFQIQDDLLDVVSDAGTYGKDLYGDVREGKRTLMLIHLRARSRRRTTGRSCGVPGPTARRTARNSRCGASSRSCTSTAASTSRPTTRRSWPQTRARPLRRRVRRLPRLAGARLPPRARPVHGRADARSGRAAATPASRWWVR